MRNVIYQYWDGPITAGVKAGVAAMKQYAERIGAEYVFEDNPKWQTSLGKYSPHYGAFKPLFDKQYDDYDNILFADVDVFPVEHLAENVFDQFHNNPDIEVGICEEWKQPEIRTKVSIAGINSHNDLLWANVVNKKFSINVPKTAYGLLRVFNSGVVLYSKAGRLKAQQRFMPFREYVSLIENSGLPSFYTCDQPYLHAMLDACSFKWTVMDYKWNSSVFYTPGTSGVKRPVTDLRDHANFVHVQLNGKLMMDADKLWRVANLPVEEWNL